MWVHNNCIFNQFQAIYLAVTSTNWQFLFRLCSPWRNLLLLSIADCCLGVRSWQAKIMFFFLIKYLFTVSKADSYVVLCDMTLYIMAETYFIRQCSLFGDLAWHSSMKFLNVIFYCCYSLSILGVFGSMFSLSWHKICSILIYFMLHKLS